jgi:hypothetical protein
LTAKKFGLHVGHNANALERCQTRQHRPGIAYSNTGTSSP